MKSITIKELAGIMMQEDKTLGNFHSEANLIESKPIETVVQTYRPDSPQIGASETISTELKTVEVSSSIDHIVPSVDAKFTFFYKAKFSFTLYELENLHFDSIYESSICNIASGIEGYEITDLNSSPVGQKAMEQQLEVLRPLARSAAIEYLREKEGMDSGGFGYKDAGPTSYYLKSHNEFDLTFVGRLRARVQDERYGEFSLYETSEPMNVFVCQKISPTGEISTASFSLPDDAVDFFGFGYLAKRLYAECGFRYTKKISDTGLKYYEKCQNHPDLDKHLL